MVSRHVDGNLSTPVVSPTEGNNTAAGKAHTQITSDENTRLDIESDIALDNVLLRVRWVMIAGLLLLSLAQPLTGRLGLPTWTLILGFAGYSVIVVLLRRSVVWLQPYSRIAALDLVVVGALYTVAASPGGPVFVLFLLITIGASCTTTLPRSLLYTGVVLVIMVIISPTLPHWTHDTVAVRDLVARLIVLAVANVGTILLVRQLNHERRTALAASRAAERQTELHRLRETFVASVSHELRTPLTALRAGLGMLDLSLSDRLRADEKHLLGTARRNSERLKLLVDDLLMYNQLEAGALHLERDTLNLSDVVCDAVSAVRPLMEETGHSVTLALAERLPCLGDTRRLEQVLINLVANACEHTPSGTTISIEGAATLDETLLTVSDDGPGIPPAELERVFHPFHRIIPSRHGSGLGLAIAQRIVELHGGRIWAHSEASNEHPYKTTFSIALPIRPMENA